MAGLLGAMGCGGNVANDVALRGGTYDTGGATSSSGGSASIARAVDAGQDADATNSDCDYCCSLYGSAACATHIQMQADVRIVNMLLVIDKSASMNDKPTPASTQSRWDIIKAALNSTLTLPEVLDNINFGLELFPYDLAGIDPNTANPTLACQLPTGGSAIEREIAGGAANLRDILDVLSQQTPGGYSPTAKALNEAYNYYTIGAGKDLKGSKWVLLATSGASDCNAALNCEAGDCIPNHESNCPQGDWIVNCCANAGFLCSDADAVVFAISKLASAGIKTFVVGVPIWSVEVEYLNHYAQAGLAPNPTGSNGESYYSVSPSQTLPELVAALLPLTTKLVRTCDIPLTTALPIDTNSIRVAKDCVLIPEATSNSSSQMDAGQADGWLIDYSQNPPHLRLVGNYCLNITTQGAMNLDILWGCNFSG